MEDSQRSIIRVLFDQFHAKSLGLNILTVDEDDLSQTLVTKVIKALVDEGFSTVLEATRQGLGQSVSLIPQQQLEDRVRLHLRQLVTRRTEIVRDQVREIIRERKTELTVRPSLRYFLAMPQSFTIELHRCGSTS